MALTIEQHHIDAAWRAGACKDRRDQYPPGKPLDQIQSDDLAWVAAHVPGVAAEIHRKFGASVPLPLFGRSGDGYGDGYGHGHGYGSGDGYGHGYGDGYGDGDGDGYGYGDGDGYGYGYGDGNN